MTVLKDIFAESEPSESKKRRHFISWFIEEGEVHCELECLDEPLPPHQECECQYAKTENYDFILGHVGTGKTPLRNGIIVSRWVTVDNDGSSELQWWYEGDGPKL